VLIVSAWDPTSGVLTFHRSLARHLAARGVHFSAYAFDGWQPETLWSFCDRLIDGRSVTLSEVLMEGDYDLIHCVDTTYSPPWGVEKWVRRARFRGPIILMAQVAIRELTEQAHATSYVACSKAAAETLARDADGPVELIYNGYDEQVFVPGRVANVGDLPLLVWVGRMTEPRKGAALFLDAVELLPNHRAVLVDAGGRSDALEDRIARLGARVERRSSLTPSQMADLYREASASGGAFLSTSTYEGFPFAVVEAMACECPVVVSRAPGHEEFVDGLQAVVYELENGPAGILEALDQLGDTGLRDRLALGARVEAERRWTSAAMADAYYSVYTTALDKIRGSGRLTDPVARAGWRLALRARPAWRRLRGLTSTGGVALRRV
jgi:glycosyltransferase involved in cell wall biosynthesis